MEIIAEILFQILGWLFQFFGEIILQIIVEAIAELIGHSLRAPLRRSRPVHPGLAAVGYAIFGALAGTASLWLLPDLFIKAPWLRVANVVVAPIIAGLLMAWIGAWRQRRDKEVIRLESFAYGWCFAFTMATVRFVWGH